METRNQQNQTSSPSIAVACAADDAYAMPLAVTTRSLLDNFSGAGKIVLFILDGGIQPHNRQRIARSLQSDKLEIVWIDPAAYVGKLSLDRVPTKRHFPISTYYRFLLPEIVPAEFDKAIYLDSDLVIEADIERLWQIELGDNYVLAAQDLCQRSFGELHHLDCEAFGVSPTSKYFNAGVLVLNLNLWRSHQIAQKAVEMSRKHAETLLFLDQDALNLVLVDRWGELNPQWNQMHDLYQYASWQDSPYDEATYSQARQHPYIRHYTTLPKPWMPACTHPHADRFYYYLDRTAWSGWRNTIWRRLQRRVRKEIQQRLLSRSA